MDNRIPPGSYFHHSPVRVHGSLRRSSSLPAEQERISPGSYFQHSPARAHGPLLRSSSLPFEQGRYLEELLAERQKLGPFMQILPLCSMLINREITRMSNFISDQGTPDHERSVHEYPFRSPGHQQLNGGPMDLPVWSPMHKKENGLQRMALLQASAMGWNGIPHTPVVKRVVRLDVPVDKYPNYNFVGRILGPRGNSLKRFEATTECRVFIRGRGSVKDSIKEDKLKDKPGYEHLNEPLHLLIEAEFPEDLVDARMDHAVNVLEDLLKPVDENMDQLKKQQLRELAMINGTLREESPGMSPSMSPGMSPFNSSSIKRAKTGC